MNTKHTPGPTLVHRLNVMQADDGQQHVMAVFADSPCGCKIVGGGTCPQPLTIEYCPQHAAAPALLEACQAVVSSPGFGDATEPGQPSDLDGGPVNVTYFSQETIDAIRAAISLALGKDRT